jgi:hypothetical protein
LNRVSREAPGPTHKVHDPVRQGLIEALYSHRIDMQPPIRASQKKIAAFSNRKKTPTQEPLLTVQHIHKYITHNNLR